MPSISAAMIVRDEAAVLKDCLESIRPFVEHIVVVDTGSSDETALTARAYGAKVCCFDWVDDFSAARNASLDACEGEWILYIDADERLSVPEGISLRDS